MKKFKKIVSLALALTLVMGLATVASASVVDDKATIHDDANVMRRYLTGDNNLFIKGFQLCWAFLNGESVGGSYLYDARTNTYYGASEGAYSYAPSGRSNGVVFKWSGYTWYQAMDGSFYRWSGQNQIWATDSENVSILRNGTYQSRTTVDVYGGNSVNINNGTSYYDGTYTWIWDSSRGDYFRYGSNGTQIWRNGGTSGINAGSNSYSGYNWFGGVINTPYEASRETRINALVGLLAPYSGKLSSYDLSKIAWAFLEIADKNSISYAKSLFKEYQEGVSDAELRKLAADVVFRWDYGKSLGNNYTLSSSYANGRTLCPGYTKVYMNWDGSKVTSVKFVDSSENPEPYTLQSPY